MTNLTTTGAPTARSSHAAVYDAANNRMLTFMGWNGSVYYSDIYSLSLTSGSEAWLLKSSTLDGINGSPRYGFSAVYDNANQRAIAFGGYGESTSGLYYPINESLSIELPSSGTLYYDGISSLVNLMAGDGSMSAYDSDNHQMIRFGGYSRIYDTNNPEDTGYHINETWSYGVDDTKENYNAWSNISPYISPASREVCSLIYDSANKRAIMWGGLSYNQNSSFNDTWSMSLDSTSSNYKKWIRVLTTGTAPSRRWGAAAIYDPDNERMVLFGGAEDTLSSGITTYNNVFTLSLTPGSEAWSSNGLGLTIGGTAPSGRFQSTPVYDPDNIRMLVYGGQTGANSYTNQLYELAWTGGAPNTMTWTSRTPSYSPSMAVRRGQTAVYQGDFSDKRMIIFGGWDGTTHYNEVWNFNITNPTVTASLITTVGTPPAVRRSHNAIYDSINQRMIIEGGRGSSTPVNFFDDFWSLSLGSSTSGWTWNQINPNTYLKTSVNVSGLTNNTAYHWQAWSTGSTAGDTSKISFGSNAESAYDFIIGTVTGGGSGIKTVNGLNFEYVKTMNGLIIANVKSVDGLE
jgi:hypothetical protein